MSKRLEVLKNSLEKKNKLFDDKVQNHFDTVKQANGQPLNDKRNGAATMRKWEKQNDSIRNTKKSIEKTEAAIEREESKIANVNAQYVPDEIKKLLDDGTLTQWRKYPNRFFVKGVERARIVLIDDTTVAHVYLKEIPNQEQYTVFRNVFNALNHALNAKKQANQAA